MKHNTTTTEVIAVCMQVTATETNRFTQSDVFFQELYHTIRQLSHSTQHSNAMICQSTIRKLMTLCALQIST